MATTALVIFTERSSSSVACGVATSFGRCGSLCKIGTQRVSYRALYRALYTGGKRDKLSFSISRRKTLERELFALLAPHDARTRANVLTIYPYSTE